MKEDLRRFLVHLHITPGLIEDYQELIKTIINQANKENGKFCLFKYFIDKGQLPKAVYIIRLKLSNLQEDDVDLRNLPKDLHSIHKGNRPLVHIFDLDSKAPDYVVDELINKIMHLIVQDMQFYIDSNLFALCKPSLEEKKSDSQLSDSFFELTMDKRSKMGDSAKINGDSQLFSNKSQKYEKDFVESIQAHLEQEKHELEVTLEQSIDGFSRERFHSII
jgi:hypothetical protein